MISGDHSSPPLGKIFSYSKHYDTTKEQFITRKMGFLSIGSFKLSLLLAKITSTFS